MTSAIALPDKALSACTAPEGSYGEVRAYVVLDVGAAPVYQATYLAAQLLLACLVAQRGYLITLNVALNFLLNIDVKTFGICVNRILMFFLRPL